MITKDSISLFFDTYYLYSNYGFIEKIILSDRNEISIKSLIEEIIDSIIGNDKVFLQDKIDFLIYLVIDEYSRCLNIDHKQVLSYLKDLLVKKNTDYGDSFSMSIEKFGLISFAIRLYDKLNRYLQLKSNDALISNESINDTLLDIAGYCFLYLIKYK